MLLGLHSGMAWRSGVRGREGIRFCFSLRSGFCPFDFALRSDWWSATGQPKPSPTKTRGRPALHWVTCLSKQVVGRCFFCEEKRAVLVNTLAGEASRVQTHTESLCGLDVGYF